MLPFACCLALIFTQQVDPTSSSEGMLPLIVQAKKAGPALQLNELSLEEDGSAVKLLGLSQRNAQQPMLWVVVLDTSNSQHEEFERKRRAAIAIIESLPATDKFITVAFDTGSQVSKGQTRDEAVSLLRDARAGGGTALFDALALAADLAQRVSSTPGGKVMLLFTDGDDNQSRVFFDDAVERLQAADTTTFGLVLNGINSVDRGSRVLQQLTEATGGALLAFKNDVDAVKVISSWQNVLRARIFVNYERALPEKATKQHALHLTTQRKDLKLFYPRKRF